MARKPDTEKGANPNHCEKHVLTHIVLHIAPRNEKGIDSSINLNN